VLVAGAPAADEVLRPVSARFAAQDVQETPSFERHVVNLFGRLGCNGRSCHGSFQGQGGFQLSLFGYDFKADHGALLAKDNPRIDVAHPAESLILTKPTDADMHEGGQRYKKDSWQYRLLLRWIESGAKLAEGPDQLARLEVMPAEIRFRKQDEQVQLQVVAVWQDGTREDVTPLCRFQSNDDAVAKIDEAGRVTAGEPGDTHIVVSYDKGVQPIPVLQPVIELTDARYPRVETPTKVDERVVAKLRKLGIVPSAVCGDAEFLRRVSLDLTGTLPAPRDVESFLADKSPNKRAQKIEDLLETPAYAAWWTTRLCDFTGNNDEQLINATPVRGQAGKQWYDWIYKRVAENTPYDQLAAGIVTAVSRQPEQDYLEYCREMSDLSRQDAKKSYADRPAMTHYWARRDFRDPDARAIAFAYSFMGTRIECAQCHKHPFDQWSKEDFHQFKNFFTGVVAVERRVSPGAQKQYAELLQQLGLKDSRGNDLQRELPKLLEAGNTVPFSEVFVARAAASRGRGGRNASPGAATAKLLGGDVVDLAQHADPRQVVMEWLRDKNNRFFAPAFVNRVWANYFHAGIVNPPDDLSLANPPSNKPLFDYLAQGFIASGFDMKWLHRQIANSRTYQASWEPNETNKNDQRNFSRAIPRRLPAEVLYDAIQQATASDERIAQLRQDVRGRAIAIPGAGPRNNRAGGAAYALSVFGRSTRASNCDCDRSAEASLLQTVYLQNDRDVLQLTDIRQGGWLDQVAKQLRPQKPASAGPAADAARQLQSQRKQIESIRTRLTQLKNSGDREAAQRLEKRLAVLQNEIQRLAKKPAGGPEPIAAATADLEFVVRQAYLRTVSRYPADEELRKSVSYIEQAQDPVAGVRDVLWALLNTKEFVVNH
jgi:hypothetical protein